MSFPIKFFRLIFIVRLCILSHVCGSHFSSFFFKAVIQWIEIKAKVHKLLFSLLNFTHLAKSDLSFDDFSFNFLSIGAITIIFNVRRLKWALWVLTEFFLDFMYTFEGLLIMLTLYDCRFILFVHTLNGLTSISIEILVTGLD